MHWMGEAHNWFNKHVLWKMNMVQSIRTNKKSAQSTRSKPVSTICSINKVELTKFSTIMDQYALSKNNKEGPIQKVQEWYDNFSSSSHYSVNHNLIWLGKVWTNSKEDWIAEQFSQCTFQLWRNPTSKWWHVSAVEFNGCSN